MRYRESDGLLYVLQSKLKDKKEEFPNDEDDFIHIFEEVFKHLSKKIYPYIIIGAANKGDGVLTDHGEKHVKMVIRYAYKLLGKTGANSLLGYEVYLLLLSILFHDVGNITGRRDHEKKIRTIMVEMGEKLQLDNIEKMIVIEIASAHGGKLANTDDPDTLRDVDRTQFCRSLEIRSGMLAAILRFADEISDDRTRAIPIAELSKENRIFHEYSSSLEPIVIEPKDISFEYHLPIEKIQKEIETNSGSVYLYDEILERLAKCMRELEYCRKYADGKIQIVTLNVKVFIVTSDYKRIRELKFSLRLSGYPDKKKATIHSYLSDGASAFKENGSILKQDIEGLLTGGANL
jgi:hypothetical protein